MIYTAIFNAMLAAGVIVMVVTPLVWAILTQHRDHRGLAATDDGATVHAPQTRERRRTRQQQAGRPDPASRQYKPMAGRV